VPLSLAVPLPFSGPGLDGSTSSAGTGPLASPTAVGFSSTGPHGAGSLKAHVMEFVLRNFDAVIKTPAFRDLSRELILEVLQRR
jgi:hypothetical protein